MTAWFERSRLKLIPAICAAACRWALSSTVELDLPPVAAQGLKRLPHEIDAREQHQAALAVRKMAGAIIAESVV